MSEEGESERTEVGERREEEDQSLFEFYQLLEGVCLDVQLL